MDPWIHGGGLTHNEFNPSEDPRIPSSDSGDTIPLPRPSILVPLRSLVFHSAGIERLYSSASHHRHPANCLTPVITLL